MRYSASEKGGRARGAHGCRSGIAGGNVETVGFGVSPEPPGVAKQNVLARASTLQIFR